MQLFESLRQFLFLPLLVTIYLCHIACRARMHSRFGREMTTPRAKSSRNERDDAPRGSRPVQVEVSGKRVSASAPRLDARRTISFRPRSLDVVVGIARPHRRRCANLRLRLPSLRVSLSLSPPGSRLDESACRRE